ncbi:unnamed protein product [Spirodela intermedia]|uniref:Small ribosomal subunit protein uS17c n=1 Tax=Spirodela intermedia TaxID=51605 RepID=A0A7I8J197_SPIIN|nr:unnamed protein product [Spirodela intermedia]CAA6663829.1 unnamed protein product [Spirodela intermedia]
MAPSQEDPLSSLPEALLLGFSPLGADIPPANCPGHEDLQGRVVSDANDKTVAVEVTRLAPHPKYKRRIRKKKTYQAHDPENKFKIGDFVQLEKSRPISKTKTFLAIPVAARNAPKPVEDVPQDLGLPLESQT